MRTVFCVSDRTAITVERVERSMLARFVGRDAYTVKTVPYIGTMEKASETVTRINAAAQADGVRPLVLSTVADAPIRACIANSDGILLDLYDAFLERLQPVLDAESAGNDWPERIALAPAYQARMGAVEYTLSHDDGNLPGDYGDAEIILAGVSRSGKTPTCVYLAMQWGIRAANYPITEDDLSSPSLPSPLRSHVDRIHGLTIQPKRLADIRQGRRPDSRYAAVDQCRTEVRHAEALFKTYDLPYIDVTKVSVEEIAAQLAETHKLHRRNC